MTDPAAQVPNHADELMHMTQTEPKAWMVSFHTKDAPTRSVYTADTQRH